MSRVGLAVAWAVALAPATAAADDPYDLAGFLGPRVFSGSSRLGYIDSAPGHPMLQNSVELGARVSRQFLWPWLFPELELAISPTHTNEMTVNGADIPSVDIFWMEPRVQLRAQVMARPNLMPFVVIGGGAPIDLSAARKTLNSGITGDGYVGAGVRYATTRGVVLRFDARLAFLPGIDPMTGDSKLAFEGDITFGAEFALDSKRRHEASTPAARSDRDNDGIPDELDKCPDQPEDKDGFQDADGCPDIDNDGDGVLDIADKCPTEQETRNGFEDEDGCPDTVPADVEAIRGTVERLVFAESVTAVHDAAKATITKIAKVMAAHPTLRIVLVGHTDDREAKAFAGKPKKGQPPPDIAALAMDMSRARAEAVRQALIAAHVDGARIQAEGVGANEPVADNSNARGRRANRRVELKLLVAKP
jgi:outer membrane protein OmpA-like peptidoglycan-associated protein